MSRAVCCPNCGAPIEKRMCEYCGRDTEVELVSEDEAVKMMEDERFMSIFCYPSWGNLYEGEIGKMNGARIVIQRGDAEE